ncbi:tail fiber domain-containing protein [Dyadobacter crusticola]|uniref:tail fiber domain-containing protein n=1 Tax=Dyadobacter crusticola TaxID=292407 RepID=UPI0004E260B0|nr:tail fiber domain-containing protein [Dyadobacter crusticola]
MKTIYKLSGAAFLLAGMFNSVCGQTTSYGSQAGDQGTDGTYVGIWAGSSTVGEHNTFVGSLSGFANIGGNQNTALGSRSAFSISHGSENTFLGYLSGKSNTTGSWNTFVGSKSGAGSGVGLRNTFIGVEAGGSNYFGNENIFIGCRSGFFNKEGNYNLFAGNGAGEYNTSGHYNVFLGHGAGNSNLKGLANTYIGHETSGSANVTYATAVGAKTKVTRDHSIVLGTIFDNVGIGVEAPTYKLHLSTFSAAKAGSSAWIVASDKRLKKDISDYTEGLDVLKQIKPVWFNYNGAAGLPTDKKFVGIIAQDVQKIAPHMVGTFTYQDSLGNKTEYLDYDANAMTYMLVNSVKEQQQMIEQKDEEIRQLTAETAELTKRLAQLERIVASNMTRPLTNPAARTNEVNENGVILEQNSPNGFSGSSSIRFFIPETIKDAVLNIYSTNGHKIRTEVVKTRGEGSIQLSAHDFGTGVFIYDLVTDGKSNGAKKMMVSK